MIKKSSKMTEGETIEYMAESLKKGADIARRLAKIQGKQKWNDVANLLNRIHQKSSALAKARSLNRTDTLVLLDIERRKLNPDTVH